jgi:hypothetical protein
MAQRIINTGTADYAGDGESLRDALIKVNDNFTEVYTDLSAVQSFDGDYNSLTNKPDLSVYALTANTFNGDYNNLTNLPDLTTLATFDGNLGTVTDVTLTNVTDGQVLTYDNTTSQWINAAPASGSSSFDQDLNTTNDVTFNSVETNSLTIGGTGFVNFNNDAFDDTYYGGFTTDKSILQINGANYLAGSDDGGGVIISGGMARNGGNNGDVIIASGGGGADDTGYISLLSGYITASGTWIGTQTMDIKGSVFGDDSTLLVDGVAGKIVGPVDTASITQSDTGNFTSNFTTTITQDSQYTKFTKVDVFDNGEFVDTINREIKLGANSLLFDSTVGASAIVRNDGIGGSLLLEAGTGNANEGNADGGDIVITSGYPGVGGDGGNIILNSNADIFVGPLSNTSDIRIGGGPGYAGGTPTTFYGPVDFNGQTVTGLSASADVYLVDGGTASSIYTNGDLVLDGGNA